MAKNITTENEVKSLILLLWYIILSLGMFRVWHFQGFKI